MVGVLGLVGLGYGLGDCRLIKLCMNLIKFIVGTGGIEFSTVLSHLFRFMFHEQFVGYFCFCKYINK